jgi:protein arginine kinase
LQFLPYVISSRVRIARNLRNYRFPNEACSEERRAVLEDVQTAASKTKWFNNVHCIYIDTLSSLERRVLEEKHLISPLFGEQGVHRLAIVAKTFDFSILVNEEDHLRIQAIRPGMQIRKAWDITKNLEMSLREKLDFAYSDQYGYCTTCSSNVGTGIRLSVMMFLPGLILLKRITPILQQIVASGYTVRGMYGEGSKSQGYLLQISKQIMYKEQKMDILRNLERICHSIIVKEQLARSQLLRLAGMKLCHRIEQVCHSFSTAERVTFSAGIRMLAMLRLGIALGIEYCHLGKIDGKIENRFRNLRYIDGLWLQIQPAHVLTYEVPEHQYNCPVHHYLAEQEDEDYIRPKVIKQELGIGK